VELQEYDLAIKAYKRLKDECERYGGREFRALKMKTYEQIAVCYSNCQLYNVSITYYKKALQIAYQTQDNISELFYYEKLARAYMNAGDPDKMVLYH
jgi:tetratricopeptide (TPR) repeat protein